MATPTAAKPDRVTGLPPGVSVAPLGRRLVAQLVDAVVPAVLGLVAYAVGDDGPGASAASVIAVLLIIAWCLLVWWMFATRAAGPGMRLVKLQLVGFTNGRPIGWGRFLVRSLVLALLTASVVGLLVMLVFLLRHPRHQGWHDLTANSVVIVERPLAPRSRPAAVASSAGTPGQEPAPSKVAAGAGAAGVAGRDPLPTAVPASALPMAPSGAEVGVAPLAPGRVAAGEVPPPATRTAPAPESAEETTQPGAVPATAGTTPTWVAVLDDGREVPVRGLVLLGRNPQPRPGEEGAELIKVADESRTVSKSHLALDVDAGGLFVVDRGSTNGSTVTTADGRVSRCVPGDAVRADEGSVVSMGDHWLTLRRG
jgi:RDD family protein/FHA domain-containing protein